MCTSLLSPFVTALGIIISAIIAIIAWTVNAKKNREHEIFKKLLDYRIQTYNDAFKLLDIMSLYAESDYKELGKDELRKNFFDLVIKAKRSINTFGNDDEIRSFNKCLETFDTAVAKKTDKVAFDDANRAFREVKYLLSKNLRKQLGLN